MWVLFISIYMFVSSSELFGWSLPSYFSVFGGETPPSPCTNYYKTVTEAFQECSPNLTCSTHAKCEYAFSWVVINRCYHSRLTLKKKMKLFECVWIVLTPRSGFQWEGVLYVITFAIQLPNVCLGKLVIQETILRCGKIESAVSTLIILKKKVSFNS